MALKVRGLPWSAGACPQKRRDLRDCPFKIVSLCLPRFGSCWAPFLALSLVCMRYSKLHGVERIWTASHLGVSWACWTSGPVSHGLWHGRTLEMSPEPAKEPRAGYSQAGVILPPGPGGTAGGPHPAPASPFLGQSLACSAWPCPLQA